MALAQLRRRDFVVGLTFVALGGAYAVAALSTLPMGTAARMGSGFLPFFVALGLLVCGLVLLYQVGRTTHPVAVRPSIAWGVLLKLSSLFLAYGGALYYLGLLPAVGLLLLGSRLFYPDLGWRRLLGLLVLTLLALWALVVWVLQLNVPLWPGQA